MDRIKLGLLGNGIGRSRAKYLHELIGSLYGLQLEYLPMDLADASLLILAEHLGHGRILSTDERDFKTYRWKRHKPFTNLMFD